MKKHKNTKIVKTKIQREVETEKQKEKVRKIYGKTFKTY